MSGTMNLKDVRRNAERLMGEKDYESALTNWSYVIKNSDEIKPSVYYQVGK